jgi:glycosyltransferase involved in cell wall biosynthesis
MKIVYAHNWFLDYRIPVFKELKKITNDNFYVLYNKDNVPNRIHEKLKDILGDKAVTFSEEKVFTIGDQKKSGDFANKIIKISYQPGLYSKIKELKPDVLIGEGFFRWGIINLLYRFFNKTKYLMLYERTKYTERNVKKVIEVARKITLKLMDGINCNGELCKDYILSLGYDSNKISSKHMVADTYAIKNNSSNFNLEQRKEFKEKLGLKGKVFLYCGQIVKRKGIFELLEAWDAFYDNEGEECTLLMIGSGEESEFVKEKINKKNSIKLLDKVDFDIIYKYFSIADVFVILTLEDNGSIVLPEAMSAGLPVITSKYNGNHPEYVSNKNGWVVDPNNIEEVKNVFNEVLKSTKLQEMGKNSIEIIENFTPEIAALNIYNASLRCLEK